MSIDSDILRVTLLGAGQEVGRSCCVLQYKGKTVVCDAGIHPAYSGISSLPFVDELDWSTVDAILITHFHLDHAGALTYLTEKTNFREGNGKVYMTHPTKSLHTLMMQDYLRTSSSPADILFTSQELSASLVSIIPISVHQHITPCPGVSFVPLHAGHVLGACMYLIDIAGLKILYTGDYSRTENRHLVKAEVPPVRPDVLIIESTFGVQTLASEHEQERRFTNLVHSIVTRGGHVLLPVFALGTAQELLLILEDYWSTHPELSDVPVYYASSLAKKCMSVYQAQTHTMNANVRSRFARRDNPFVFKHISSISREHGWERKIAEGPPCVVLASPGFMQVGASRELLELWAPDPRNGVIITGFSVEGTMTRDIQAEPEEIPSLKEAPIPRRLTVDYIPFSAHVDYSQNAEFIELVKADHVVLVHGERNAMSRLRTAMTARYTSRGETFNIHTPQNLEVLELSFSPPCVAKVIGTFAEKLPQEGDILSGLLVTKDHTHSLLDPQDLYLNAGLSTCTLRQRQRIALGTGWDLIRWHLEGMFGSVEKRLDGDGVQMFRVMGVIDVKYTSEYELTVEWESSAVNDMIADSTLAVIVGADHSLASVQLTCLPSCVHPHAKLPDDFSRMQRVVWFLQVHFGEVNLHTNTENGLDILTLTIDFNNVVVTCVDEILKQRVENVIDMAVRTTSSLMELFDPCMNILHEDTGRFV
ncbi:beta-lactamase-like protein [Scleroderma yunnanense]